MVRPSSKYPNCANAPPLWAILLKSLFNIFTHTTPIDKKSLIEILDELLTPKLAVIGIVKQKDYQWYSPHENEIRPGFSYDLLKGAHGTFSWGICIDFIPIPYGGKLTYFRTEKSFKFHLFEWPDEYLRYTTNSGISGMTSHLGKRKARESIKQLFDRYENRILAFFEEAKTLENVIEHAIKQVDIGKTYNLHYPNPSYVLAFLYAKSNQTEKALQLLDSLELSDFNNKEELFFKARKKILELSGIKNGP